jgi:hypothetical protein
VAAIEWREDSARHELLSDSGPRYAAVNELHGQGYPPLTRADAYRYAAKLLKRFGSKADASATVEHDLNVAGKLHFWCDGNKTGRRCWASVQPTRGHRLGWGRMIHDIAHAVHRYRHPTFKAHAIGEHAVETEIAYYVRHSTDWLTPREQPALDPLLKVVQASARDCANRERWQRKLERAKHAIAKLTRRIKARERRLLKQPGRARVEAL